MIEYACDLHMHTNRSDGNDTPKELIDSSAALGMAIIAITDHDIRPPDRVSTDEGEVDIREYAASKSLSLLCGIEISCETNIEDTHIVGFGCKWDSPYFAELESSVASSKTESYKLLVERLCAEGYALAWDEVLNNNGSPVPENAVQKKMIFEALARKGYAKSWNDAKLLIKGAPQFQINRRKPTAASAIKAIGQAGGVSILAHPYLISETVLYDNRTLTRDEFIRVLISHGLNGIEANYTYDKTSYGGTMTKEEIAAEVIERYGSTVEIVSGGSDYHADHKKGVANARRIGEAGVGMEHFRNNRRLMDCLPNAGG